MSEHENIISNFSKLTIDTNRRLTRNQSKRLGIKVEEVTNNVCEQHRKGLNSTNEKSVKSHIGEPKLTIKKNSPIKIVKEDKKEKDGDVKPKPVRKPTQRKIKQKLKNEDNKKKVVNEDNKEKVVNEDNKEKVVNEDNKENLATVERVEVSANLNLGGYNEVVGREEERAEMLEWLEERLSAGRSGNLYVSGCPGSGKTLMLTELAERLAREGRVEFEYVNCMVITGGGGSLLRELGERWGVRADAVERHLRERRGPPLLLVLDEMDELSMRTQTLLYRVLGWAAIAEAAETAEAAVGVDKWRSPVLVAGISNSLDLVTTRVLPNLAALGAAARPRHIAVKPYTGDQLMRILLSRLELSGRTEVGLSQKEKLGLQLCCCKVARQTGDARQALGTLQLACSQTGAEDNKVRDDSPIRDQSTMPPPSSPCIRQVQKAFRKIEIATDPWANAPKLPLHQRLVLASCISLLDCSKPAASSKKSLQKLTLGRLYEHCREFCGRMELKAPESGEIVSACDLLDSRGLGKLQGSRGNWHQRWFSLGLDHDRIRAALADDDLLARMTALVADS